MIPPNTIVEHGGQEYLLLEEGYNDDTRAVIFCARPGDPDFPSEEDARKLRWAGRGEWLPVARWTQQELIVGNGEHAGQSDMIRKTVDDYLERTPRPPATAWAVAEGDAFAGTLTQAIPMGIAVVCLDDEAATGSEYSRSDLVPIDNIALFFTHVVRLGYAGAMWNGELPVFFCVDDTDQLQFLRLRRRGRSGLEIDIFEEHDGWQTYEGAEEVAFLDNTQACDTRMVETLGRQPVLEWPASGELVSVGPTEGTPAVLTDGEEQLRHGVLFTDEQRAEAFRQEHHPEWTVFDVDDPEAFLEHADLVGCVAQLNPGSHRAHSGTLWSDGEQIVLDSYSGFWTLTPEGFVPAD